MRLPSSQTPHNAAGEALSNRDPIETIVEQLRIVAPELDELRIRQIAVQLREDMGGRSSAPRQAASSALPDGSVAGNAWVQLKLALGSRPRRTRGRRRDRER